MPRRKPSSDSPQRIGRLVGDVIDRLGARRRLNEARVLEAWRRLCGDRVAELTGGAWVRTDRSGRCTLHVRIASATWRQELHFQRAEWATKLNDDLGEPLVTEVRFS